MNENDTIDLCYCFLVVFVHLGVKPVGKTFATDLKNAHRNIEESEEQDGNSN